MSHSITVTRTTTSNTSYIVLNTGYLKSPSGILKLLQLILGIVCVCIFAHYYDLGYNYYLRDDIHLSFMLLATTFMIGTFLLLISCIVSLSTGTILSKTIYEVVYHFFAGLCLVLISSIFVLKLNKLRTPAYSSYLTVGCIGLANSLLYFISAFIANRSYRGI